MGGLYQLVFDKYPSIAKELGGPLIELLRLSRDFGGGDIERSLVLYVIAARTIEHEDFKALDPRDLAGGMVEQPPSLRTNARSVAESLGMPRESVRRKVQDLINAGLVVRCGNDLMLSADGLNHLALVRSYLVALSIRYFQLVSSLVEAAPGEAVPLQAAPTLGLALSSRSS